MHVFGHFIIVKEYRAILLVDIQWELTNHHSTYKDVFWVSPKMQKHLPCLEYLVWYFINLKPIVSWHLTKCLPMLTGIFKSQGVENVIYIYMWTGACNALSQHLIDLCYGSFFSLIGVSSTLYKAGQVSLAKIWPCARLMWLGEDRGFLHPCPINLCCLSEAVSVVSSLHRCLYWFHGGLQLRYEWFLNVCSSLLTFCIPCRSGLSMRPFFSHVLPTVSRAILHRYSYFSRRPSLLSLIVQWRKAIPVLWLTNIS